MPVYALAHLRSVDFGPDIVEYLEKIDDTLTPFGGRFLVHSPKELTVIEGEWPGTLVILEFPDRASADAWYRSDAYQEILPLRTENTDSVAILVDGVPPDYRAASLVS